ncbi:MAG: response regulator [Lachnospiraceae bacterium]|nr:response regulator [Lachnospiraceae bacterium]
MLQKTFQAEDTGKLEEIAQSIKAEPAYKEYKSRLILIWAEIWDKEHMRDLIKRSVFLFPECYIVGMNYNHRSIILQDVGHEGNLQVSALFFESSEISIFSRKHDNAPESEYGIELHSFMQGIEHIKGVYLVTPRYFFAVDHAIREAVTDHEDVPFFGIKTTINPNFTSFCYDPETGVTADDVFIAVIFRGKDLFIRSKYNLGWTPVGKMMEVTEADNPFVANKIDGLPATQVYSRYLGLEEEQILPLNICEFPLILHRDNCIIARIGMLGPKKGQLVFGIPGGPGDVMQLSYGNPDEIFECIRKDSLELREFVPEAELLFICVNRLMLLKEREEKELNYYKRDFKEAADIYGYAEIMHDKNGGGELNSALVSVAFREGKAETQETGNYEEVKAEPVKTDENGLVPLEYRLFSFFKAMSGDLINSANEAQNANRAKTEFLSSVSHEIRTPINAILGMDEMILRESSQDEVRQYAGNIQESGRLLLGLINDLLDTARIESGKMSIIPIDYDLRTSIEDLNNIINIKAVAKGLDFNIQVDKEMPYQLFGDETRIKQCILNILNNAVKYTPAGSVTLSVGSEKYDKDHILLKVSVSDTGIGIKPEDKARLFDPFERIEEARNYSVEGTGLGLNIVINLLKMMDSGLKVDSVYGEGSVFSFEIKQEVTDWRPIGEYDPKLNKTAGIKPEYKVSFTAPDASILVVDDTEMNLVVIRALLKLTLVNIDTALSGKQALEKIKDKKYDIIFLDKQMPELDGVETLRLIRQEQDTLNADTPCIVLTADATTGAREELINAGFDDYISKPVESEQLEKIIATFLPENKLGDKRDSKNDAGAKLSDERSTYTADVFEEIRRKKLDIIKSAYEIDYEKALVNCGSEDNLLEITESFRAMSGQMITLLSEYMANEDFQAFTIKIHALKSSAAILGAISISDKARELEELGENKQYDLIKEKFPEFLKEYSALAGKLSELNGLYEQERNSRKTGKTVVAEEELFTSLERIVEKTENFEYDGALFVVQILEQFDLGTYEDEILKIKGYLSDFDGEEALKALKRLLNNKNT